MAARPVSDESQMNVDLAEVVRLHPERDLTDEEALLTSEPRPPFCSHHRRGCGRELDPFKVLVAFAGDWQQHATFRKEQQRRAKAAHERLTELLRLETNARARLKRIDPQAEKQAPQRPWGEGSAS